LTILLKHKKIKILKKLKILKIFILYTKRTIIYFNNIKNAQCCFNLVRNCLCIYIYIERERERVREREKYIYRNVLCLAYHRTSRRSDPPRCLHGRVRPSRDARISGYWPEVRQISAPRKTKWTAPALFRSPGYCCLWTLLTRINRARVLH
jgi:hypothetical protein